MTVETDATLAFVITSIEQRTMSRMSNMGFGGLTAVDVRVIVAVNHEKRCVLSTVGSDLVERDLCIHAKVLEQRGYLMSECRCATDGTHLFSLSGKGMLVLNACISVGKAIEAEIASKIPKGDSEELKVTLLEDIKMVQLYSARHQLNTPDEDANTGTSRVGGAP